MIHSFNSLIFQSVSVEVKSDLLAIQLHMYTFSDDAGLKLKTSKLIILILQISNQQWENESE